ncbi:MAG: hypothetical protein HY986_03015 [Candidatus Melainabacteria bacterium]|nr:hypothetical protein [Candidatus Melainabacteria bacterium]
MKQTKQRTLMLCLLSGLISLTWNTWGKSPVSAAGTDDKGRPAKAAKPSASINFATGLLSSALAQQLLGGEVLPSPSNTYRDAKTGNTTWVSNASFLLKENPAVSLGLLIRHEESAASARARYEKARKDSKGSLVNGLGAPAYRTSKPPELNVLKGANWIVITAGTSEKANNGAEEKLAKAVLPKIK